MDMNLNKNVFGAKKIFFGQNHFLLHILKTLSVIIIKIMGKVINFLLTLRENHLNSTSLFSFFLYGPGELGSPLLTNSQFF